MKGAAMTTSERTELLGHLFVMQKKLHAGWKTLLAAGHYEAADALTEAHRLINRAIASLSDHS